MTKQEYIDSLSNTDKETKQEYIDRIMKNGKETKKNKYYTEKEKEKLLAIQYPYIYTQSVEDIDQERINQGLLTLKGLVQVKVDTVKDILDKYTITDCIDLGYILPEKEIV